MGNSGGKVSFNDKIDASIEQLKRKLNIAQDKLQAEHECNCDYCEEPQALSDTERTKYEKEVERLSKDIENLTAYARRHGIKLRSV